MRMTEVTYDAGQPVDGYAPGVFRIGGQVHEAPLAILPGGVKAWAGLDDPAPFVDAGIDVLLVGTGVEIAHLPRAFREALEAAGIGVEPMASTAAARTYNVLLAEGRRVGVALMPV